MKDIIEIKYWFKAFTLAGLLIFPINIHIGLSMFLFGVGEWTTWEGGVAFYNYGHANYYKRLQPYNFYGILFRVFSISNVVLHFIFKLY